MAVKLMAGGITVHLLRFEKQATLPNLPGSDNSATLMAQFPTTMWGEAALNAGLA